MKCYENPSSGNLVSCGQTDMTKRIVAFRHFANAPKNPVSLSLCPPVSQVLVTIQKFVSYFAVDTRSLDYRGESVTGNNCSLL